MSDRIAANDPVEAEMGEGTVLRREKVVARSLAVLYLVMILAFGAISIAYLNGWQSDKPAFFRWLTYALVPFFMYLGLTKTVLRTVVTRRELNVQHGLRGTHIPIASIQGARVFGAERPEGGTELYLPAKQSVLVDWRDEQGKQRKTLIGSESAVDLLASIERARATKEELRIATDTLAKQASQENRDDEDEPTSESRRRARS